MEENFSVLSSKNKEIFKDWGGCNTPDTPPTRATPANTHTLYFTIIEKRKKK
jgi:hypothetical protein